MASLNSFSVKSDFLHFLYSPCSAEAAERRRGLIFLWFASLHQGKEMNKQQAFSVRKHCHLSQP
jgi:hypothetical protein